MGQVQLTDEMRKAMHEQLVSPHPPGNRHTSRKIIARTSGEERKNCSASLWPYASDALGCGEDQIEEATREAGDAGVPTEFDREGRAIIRSEGHRKAYCKAMGMFNGRDGYVEPGTGQPYNSPIPGIQ